MVWLILVWPLKFISVLQIKAFAYCVNSKENIFLPGGKISSVSLDVAIGTITLHLMPLRSPSIANVLLRPISPHLAALEINEEEWMELPRDNSRCSRNECMHIETKDSISWSK